jgi:hypothetical protein
VRYSEINLERSVNGLTAEVEVSDISRVNLSHGVSDYENEQK